MQNRDKRGTSKIVAGFDQRMTTAAAAKKAQLERWRAGQVDVNDPAYQEQQAARLAAAEAQAEKDSRRKAEKEAAKAQILADRKAAREAAEAQAIADGEAREVAKAEAAAALIALDEQRKAARDARYAARKARK